MDEFKNYIKYASLVNRHVYCEFGSNFYIFMILVQKKSVRLWPFRNQILKVTFKIMFKLRVFKKKNWKFDGKKNLTKARLKLVNMRTTDIWPMPTAYVAFDTEQTQIFLSY